MFHGILLIALTIGVQGGDNSQPSEELAAKVNPLVKQLDDATQSKRDAAEKALIALGPDVLPLLPAITARTPAETKERLGRVRSTLEVIVSEATSKPTTVTFQGEVTLGEAFQMLEKQTGNRVVGYERRPAASKIKLEFDKTPYWQALDQVLDQGGLTINPFGGEPNALVLMASGEGEAPRAKAPIYSGVFRFETLRMESRRDFRNETASGMRLAVSITWEPRITPIALRQPIEKIVAMDGDGNPIPLGSGDTQAVLNASAEHGMSAIELGIPLQLVPRNVSKISSLKGTLTALVPGRMESFEFTNLEATRDAEQQRAGVTVNFERLRKNGDLYEARIRVRFNDASNALESHRNWIYNNPAYMLDAKGERVENLGSNEGSRDENEIGIVTLFDLPNGPKGHKFIYQTPATLLQLPVEYELKDIQLP